VREGHVSAAQASAAAVWPTAEGQRQQQQQQQLSVGARYVLVFHRD